MAGRSPFCEEGILATFGIAIYSDVFVAKLTRIIRPKELYESGGFHRLNHSMHAIIRFQTILSFPFQPN